MGVVRSEVQGALAEILAPLRELHTKSAKEVTRLEGELAEAKETKREIEKLLRGSDPDFPNPYAKNGKQKRSGAGPRGGSPHKYGPSKAEAFTTWLQQNAEKLNAMNGGVGFYATEIGNAFADIPIVAQSGISAMLLQLHDAGILRLSRTGGLGGRKYYKVVA